MDYKIIADSSCDLNKDLEQRMDVELIPFKIDVEDKTFLDDENMNMKDLVSSMKASPNPIKTSCPSPGDFAESMRGADNVFLVTISSKLSGTYNSAMSAIEIIKEEAPEKFIHIFDSKSASVGETLVAMKIKEAIDEKLTPLQVVEKVEKFISEMKTYFISENLDNLVKNGRISRAKGLLINALNIKPIMSTDDGEIILLEKARGSNKAFSKLVEVIGNTGIKFEERTLAISHAGALQKANALKEDLQKLNFKEIIIVETKGLSTAYVNDGGVILAF